MAGDSVTPVRYYLSTTVASDDLMPLPNVCPHCGGGIIVRYNYEDGRAGGRCEGCSFAFSRLVFPTNV